MNKHKQASCRTACVFCNGELRRLDLAKSLAARADMLIAANAGAEYLHALDLKPHAIIRGECKDMFRAMGETFEAAGQACDIVVTVKVTNACREVGGTMPDT